MSVFMKYSLFGCQFVAYERRKITLGAHILYCILQKAGAMASFDVYEYSLVLSESLVQRAQTAAGP